MREKKKKKNTPKTTKSQKPKRKPESKYIQQNHQNLNRSTTLPISTGKARLGFIRAGTITTTMHPQSHIQCRCIVVIRIEQKARNIGGPDTIQMYFKKPRFSANNPPAWKATGSSYSFIFFPFSGAPTGFRNT